MILSGSDFFQFPNDGIDHIVTDLWFAVEAN